MKDRLSGQLDLTRLFDPGAAPELIRSLAFRADHVARDSDAVCALIGSPSVLPTAPAGTSPPPEPAADVLRAWRTSGVDLPSRISGAYALAIVDSRRGCAFSGR
jgi:hypothetical protein